MSAETLSATRAQSSPELSRVRVTSSPSTSREITYLREPLIRAPRQRFATRTGSDLVTELIETFITVSQWSATLDSVFDERLATTPELTEYLERIQKENGELGEGRRLREKARKQYEASVSTIAEAAQQACYNATRRPMKRVQSLTSPRKWLMTRSR